MVTLRQVSIRGAVVVLGAAALFAGLMLGTTGCVSCECPHPVQPRGTFEISNATRTELVGGMVEIGDERVEISYTDSHGHDWVVDYAIGPEL